MSSSSFNARRLTAVSALVAVLLTACGSSSSPESMVASAKEFIGKHDNKSAIIQLRNALQKTPDNAEARFLLGSAELEVNDPSAEKNLRKALELNYPADQVVPLLVRALVIIGESKKAVDEFGTKQLTSVQAKADLAAALGDAYLAQRNLDGAHQSYTAALTAQPGHLIATLGEARYKASSNDLPGAMALVDAVLAKQPDKVDALFLKADMLRASDKLADADALYAKIIQGHPDNVNAHLSRVMLALGESKNDQAQTLVDAMKKAIPNNYLTSYAEAMVGLKRNDFQKAHDAVLQSLKLAPGYLPATLLAGELEFRLNMLSQAQTNLQAVLARAPKHIGARRMLIATLLRLGQPSRALESLRPLLADAPNDGATQLLAGEVFLANGDMNEAEKYFQKANAQNGQMAQIHTRLGQIHMAQGDAAGAFQELQTASGLDSSNSQADLMLVMGHLRRNELDQASQAITTLEKKMPKSGLPNYLRAAVATAKQDLPGARKALEQSLQVEALYFPSAVSLARLDIRDKNWASAKKRFEAILEKDPKNPKALLALSEVLAGSGAGPDEVRAPIDRAVAGNPTDPMARLAQVRSYLTAKNPKKAVEVALEAQSALPENVEVLDALGSAQQAAGEPNSAITTFQKAVSLSPQSPQPLLRLAAVHYQNKDTDAAIQALRKALTLKPDLLEAQTALIGINAMAGKTTEAIAIAKEVQKQRPKEAIGYALEADIYGQQKKWAEASTALRQGLTVTKQPRVAISLHSTLMNGGKNAEADKLAADWIKENPKDIEMHNYLAERNLAAKQYDQAAQQYKAILAINPKNPLVLNNLAWVANQIKDPKAVEYAEQANALVPNNPPILDTLGTILVDKGDTKRGLELVRQANTIAGDNPGLKLSLARNLIKLGQKDEARKVLEALQKLDEKAPARAEAVELLKTL